MWPSHVGTPVPPPGPSRSAGAPSVAPWVGPSVGLRWSEFVGQVVKVDSRRPYGVRSQWRPTATEATRWFKRCRGMDDRGDSTPSPRQSIIPRNRESMPHSGWRGLCSSAEGR